MPILIRYDHLLNNLFDVLVGLIGVYVRGLKSPNIFGIFDVFAKCACALSEFINFC